MRLLKASTIELHEFIGERVPKYAILSHRWGRKEVSMQEMKTILPGSAPSSKGYTKIKRACALAEQYDLEYIWIDTCCIDKTSSAELSEAINSMYRWYAQSALCFAHLADVELRASIYSISERFVDSQWFRRGWTLQELLAPTNLLFFDADWQEIGTRSALVPYIRVATQIGPEFLRQETDVHDASIAQRMSWASRRRTTRVEDIAYCLMGLFDVNMPLLYGEGKKAFLRLQQELISNHSDESIYAWWPVSLWDLSGELSGMLAWDPTCFARSGHIVSIELPGMRPTPFSITNRGIAMTLPAEARKGGGYEIPMACASKEDVRAPLRLCIKEGTNGSYARHYSYSLLEFFSKFDAKDLEMKTFHVLPSYLHRYPPQDPRKSIDFKWVSIQLRPAAQAVLRLDESSEGIGWRRFVSASSPLCGYTFAETDDIVLEFLYKDRRSVHLAYENSRIALHIDKICTMNGCNVYGNDETATSRCTFNDWGGCQSRALGDGNFLWLSTRVPNAYGSDPKEFVLELDISTIDRGILFERSL